MPRKPDLGTKLDPGLAHKRGTRKNGASYRCPFKAIPNSGSPILRHAHLALNLDSEPEMVNIRNRRVPDYPPSTGALSRWAAPSKVATSLRSDRLESAGLPVETKGSEVLAAFFGPILGCLFSAPLPRVVRF